MQQCTHRSLGSLHSKGSSKVPQKDVSAKGWLWGDSLPAWDQISVFPAWVILSLTLFSCPQSKSCFRCQGLILALCIKVQKTIQVIRLTYQITAYKQETSSWGTPAMYIWSWCLQGLSFPLTLCSPISAESCVCTTLPGGRGAHPPGGVAQWCSPSRAHFML